MLESLRILRLLFYKNYLIRKRQWIVSLLAEFFVPIGLILAIWAIRNTVALPPVKIEHNTYFPATSQKALVDIATIYGRTVNIHYAPNTDPAVNSLMSDITKNCLPNNASFTHGYESEAGLIRGAQMAGIEFNPVGVVFDGFNGTSKNLKYKMMSFYLSQTQLYNVMNVNLTYYYAQSNLVTIVQLCLDEAFVKSKSRLIRQSLDPKSIFIQPLPLPPYSRVSFTDELFRQLFSSILIIALMIPLYIETLLASNEKFLGVNVLMSMNGVSNGFNIFSWLISNWIFLSITIVLPTVLMLIFSSGEAIPFLSSGNPFIIWIVFNIYVLHLLTYGLHVSAYFSKSLLVIFGLTIFNLGSVALQQYGFNVDSYPIAPYLGILLPNLLLFRAVEELNYYETIGVGVQWSNLFDVGNIDYKFGGCMGMVLILSVIGLVFHFTMTVYLYAVNPGKYGVKRHPLFFLQRKSHKTADNYMECVQENGVDGKLFESVPKDAYEPGITIRNLKKSYNISLFSSMKVHALKGVSVDFYKGQITSLLGHNGAGKTTMMSILTGMMSPSEGVILVNSKDIKNNASEILNDMGLCTQENMVFPNLTVIQQITFFSMLKGKNKSKAEIQKNVTLLLEKLKLYEKRNALPKELSGGQKRRVCLGMALVSDPSTLVLDEPTSGLDPESRRVIWDILLKMRGQKTILISTHDMEEADILGDRIAILHLGKLRSCGTAMFLKKLIGDGNLEVTLSVESSCYPEKILNKLDYRGKIVNQDGSKIVISVPNSSDLPDALDKVERKKKELGISGLSVSLISLEQVFLKVTQEDDTQKSVRQPYRTADHKITDREIFWQSVKALLRKKMTYTLKNITTILIMLCLSAVSLLIISIILKQTEVQTNSNKVIDLKLNMYNQPEVLYRIGNRRIKEAYEKTAINAGGKIINVSDSSISNALIDYAKEVGFVTYQNQLIAAAEINTSMFMGFSVNAFYSNKAVFSLPISINLLTNTMIKTALDDSYSIDISYQVMPSEFNRVYPDSTLINAFSTAIIFCFLFYPAVALFALHPLRETLTYIKHLQRMTGVSSSIYWGTIFIFDFVVLLLLIVLIMAGFVGMDQILGFRIYDWETTLISLCFYVLLAFNILPLVYCFSFVNLNASNVIRLLTYIPYGFIVLEIVMYAVKANLDIYKSVRIIRPIQKGICLLVPYVSFFHSQISFYITAQTNARCKHLPNQFYEVNCKTPYDICCSLDCHDQQCKYSVKYFGDFDKDISLEESLIYLCLTPILYFVILFILEHQLIQNLRARMNSFDVPQYITDEQVVKEKAAIAHKIATMNGYVSTNTSNGKVEDHKVTPGSSNNQVFLVYEIRKRYGKLMAVKDVSFGVNQRECFGLLGVNGAGKSTTFRMMTGGEVPDSGIMCIGDKDIKRNRKYYLSQTGYCPQNDAIIRSLNAYDHLRLFARLRGIPEDQVETETNTWINKLNLNACATQPSGTYSGGNKRRLNIAIALIGIPNLVLLDEPTTGVDPGARRSLWNVIQTCQTMGQAVVLTTHSMEECEALCSRLAIMVGGRLVCIGPCQELKQRFGAGYDIHVKMNPEKARDQIDGIKSDMTQALTCELTDENSGYLMYHVTPTDTTWRKMYDVMNTMKTKYDSIEDFSVLSSTLEQLFLLFARAANTDTSPKEM